MTEPMPYELETRDVTHGVIAIFAGDSKDMSDRIWPNVIAMGRAMGPGLSVLALLDFWKAPSWVIGLSCDRNGRVTARGWPWSDLISENGRRATGTSTGGDAGAPGEFDSSNPREVARFLARALATYGPEVNKAIGFWNHGAGIFRGMMGDATGEKRWLKPCAAAKALDSAFQQAGIPDKVDLIFSDMCHNGHIEMLKIFGKYADTVIGSATVVPKDGWDYGRWFEELLKDRKLPRDGEGWAAAALRAYRAKYRGRAKLEALPCTLAAFKGENLIGARFSNLIRKVGTHDDEGFGWLRTARNKSELPGGFPACDIWRFAAELNATLARRKVKDTMVRDACDGLRTAIDDARVERSVAYRPVSSGKMKSISRQGGLAFWFPRGSECSRATLQKYRDLDFTICESWTKYLEGRMMSD